MALNNSIIDLIKNNSINGLKYIDGYIFINLKSKNLELILKLVNEIIINTNYKFAIINCSDTKLNFIINSNNVNLVENLHTLKLTRINKSIKLLNKFKGLKHLEATFLNSFQSFNIIKDLKNLETINICIKFICTPENKGMLDISNIKDYNNLRKLKIIFKDSMFNGINDIEGVKDLNNLESLELIRDCHCCANSKINDNDFTAYIKNLDALKNLSKLKELDLSYQYIDDIEGIQNLVNITSLKLNVIYSNQLDCLKKLINLETIEWKYTLNILDLSHLSNLKNLNTLDIMGSYFCNLDKIPSIDNLYYDNDNNYNE